MKKQNYTVVPYQYRDAANYKAGGEIILTGLLSEADLGIIRSKLDSGEYFIPHDLGLGIAELQDTLESFPSEDDHVYHELLLEESEVVSELPEGKVAIPAQSFVDAFKALKDLDTWNVVAATERLGV